MAWTTPYTFTAGFQPTAAKWNEQIRDNLNVIAAVGIDGWVDWSSSATWTGSTTDPTFTVNHADYCQMGKLVIYRAKFTMSAAGSGTYGFGIPVTAADADNVHCGDGTLYDDSGSDAYLVVYDMNSTTSVRGISDARTDPGILTAADGTIAQAETGPLVGFHVGEDGSIDGISQRTVNTAYAAGTNFTELFAAGEPNGTAGVAKWYDLAVVLDITDMSDNAANGTTTFYTRRVRSVALDPKLPVWRKHATVLSNQTPNNNLNLTPTIEVVNGPANLSDVLVDWWAFGATRFSRTGR